MPHQIILRRAPLCAALGFLVVGCATTTVKTPPPVYPPPPADARFIYDATLRSEKDVRTPTWRERIADLLIGSSDATLGLSKPYGIAVKQQRVFVTDTQQRAVAMFDLPSRTFKLFGVSGDGSLQKPLGVAISAQREVFVVDASAKNVKVYDWDGNFRRILSDKSVLQRPAGIALDQKGERVYVVDVGGVDSDTHRVVVLNSQTGAALGSIGKRGTGDGEFNLPLQASTDSAGNLYVVDGGNFRIEVFDAGGKFLRSFGAVGRFGGQFSRPKGIAIDRDDHIYVVDTAFGNFQIFDAQGQFLLPIGDRGTGGGAGQFMLPSSVAVDDDGRIYVVDQFFRKVEIFRPMALPALRLREEKQN